MGTIAISEVLQSAGAPAVLPEGLSNQSREPAASANKPRGWNPEFLIGENDRGELMFASRAGLAPERNRGQAELLYREGQQAQSLVAVKKWRELWSQCTPEEESRLRQLHSLHPAAAERESLNRKRSKELRKESPDPFRLDSLETRLRELDSILCSYDTLLFSLTERERRFWGLLLECEREERVASGWKLKAQRQIACGLYGRQWDGQLCGRSYFTRFHCRNRYCADCGPIHHQDLLKKYLGLEKFVTEYVAANPAYGLKILDITAVKRGEEMPTPEHVRRFKTDVKKLIRRIASHLGVKVGYLYCLEFGFENNNLHCHGLLLSPYIEQALLSNWWREIRADGSFRVLIAAARDFKTGLAHALEYTGKYAAPTPERALELERAFHGCRRVDGLGLFFNALPNEQKEAVDLHCPCGDPDCFLRKRTDLGWLPIEHFERQGIPDLDVIRASRAGPSDAKGGASALVQ